MTKFLDDWAKDQGDAGFPVGIDEWGFPAPFDKGIDAALEGREGYATKAYFFKDAVQKFYSKSVSDALAAGGNTTTIVYSVHKGTGGNKYDGDQIYADGFGVTRKLKALGGKGVNRHWSDIVKAKASADPRNDHNKMPLVWSWYGLQRYFGK